MQGLCLYPIVNHPGWEDDRHCFNGLWDYVDGDGRRELYQPLARELESQRQLLENLPSGEGPPLDRPDTHLLDVAAHWMEIRSGREDILHK